MEKDWAIEPHHLTKRFGAFAAVNDVDFLVKPGECFGLLGPNGAGKSSIVKMIYAFSPVSTGELTVLGEDVKRSPRAIKARLGVVAQEDNLDPELSVRDNLLIYAGYFRLSQKEASRRADEILRFMDLEKKSQAIVETLSGGQKRRLTIGRALINEPELLILDEPTTGLDPFARHLVWQRLRQLKEAGTTMFLTTHYLEEASQLCDRLIILHQGEIVEQGTPSELVERHVGAEAFELGVRPELRQRFKDWAEPLSKGFHEFGDDFVFFTDHGERLAQELRNRADKEGISLSYQRLRPTHLEDVFLKLTGETFATEPADNAGEDEKRDQEPEAKHNNENRQERESKQERQDEQEFMRLPDWSWPLIGRVFKRNLKVFGKTWKANLMFNFLEPLLYLWAMGFGLGMYVSQINGLSYLQFLAPGLIASSTMFATTYEMTYGSFTRMGYQKVFHGMVATPVGMDDVLMGEILYGTFKGVLYGSVFFAVVALFGVAKSFTALWLLLPLALMAMLFSILSLIWTAIAPNYDSFGYFFTLFISPMFLFAGIFFPVDNLPAAARYLSWFTPLYHAVDVVRPLVIGRGYGGIGGHLIWLAVLAVLTLPFPLVMVKKKLIQ